MITAFAVLYLPATDRAPARLAITRLDDQKRQTVGYDYGAKDPFAAALNLTFGVPIGRAEWLGSYRHARLYGLCS
jgi:hypothetical protein